MHALTWANQVIVINLRVVICHIALHLTIDSIYFLNPVHTILLCMCHYVRYCLPTIIVEQEHQVCSYESSTIYWGIDFCQVYANAIAIACWGGGQWGPWKSSKIGGNYIIRKFHYVYMYSYTCNDQALSPDCWKSCRVVSVFLHPYAMLCWLHTKSSDGLIADPSDAICTHYLEI